MNFIMMVLLALSIGFWTGNKYASRIEAPPSQPEAPGVEGQVNSLTAQQMREYRELKDQAAKYAKANEILAQIMQIFIADLGLKMQNANNVDFIAQTQAPAVPGGNSSFPDPQAPSTSESGGFAPSNTSTTGSTANDAGLKKSFSTGSKSSPGGTDKINPEQARGSAKALYQAILWRDPDPEGEKTAVRMITAQGWNGFMRSAQSMVTSPEFQNDVEPSRTVEEIVGRMYTVFHGRCPSNTEMSTHLQTLRNRGPSGVVSGILVLAKNNAAKLYEGGFAARDCR